MNQVKLRGKIKNIINGWVPPIVVSAFKKPEIRIQVQHKIEPQIWSGNYETWSDAKARSTGYDGVTILEKCKTALLKVKNGEAVYERDSVLFDEIEYSWGLLAGLQRAALESNGKLCVMDFGGSLGSTYYQNKDFLQALDHLQWCIVEQSNFVDCGKQYFENEELKFYYTVDECILKHKPNVLLLSSVLQYLERPYEWIAKFVALKIPYIIIDRTAFVDSERDILSVQNVPEEIYKASYPAWFFGEKFVRAFTGKYRSIAKFDSGFTNPVQLDKGIRGYWEGMILHKIDT
ncbi:methyltransferase, TIGR04325 family [Ginsengibacter hankyongi]|uniref:Methyltransferase, TIGR04325 family n=1 Tax=Ginsengibacter hankyongi TaxID=2607284 RepID=A0A5J5ID84_9BACT|nr:TIGR04325 family methyltransferase [Ginsengibacter hankyongi]KAA9036383.1 methyltransferase, TIGR04325 family [Ginsengibacter hankyongi]